MSLLLALTASGGGAVNYTLSGAAGSYSYTGKSATFTVGKKLSGAAGSYAYTGQAGILTYTPGSASVSYSLSGAYGVYSVSGQQATLSWSGQKQETGGAGANRPKRVYIERDGKILVFANASRAANYISAEKKDEAHKAVERPTSVEAPQAPKRAEVRAIHQPQEIIAYDAIAGLIESFNLAKDISALIQRHELDAIMALYQKARELQDEEDIELLLLAA